MTDQLIITIIGSRKTPANILEQMQACAEWFMRQGFIVRSGAAGGADNTVNLAFHANLHRNNAQQMPEIYVPWEGFAKETQGQLIYSVQGDNPKARAIAESIHPAWDKCSKGAKALHTRNVCQILGEDLSTPSNVVLYWCKERKGKPTGGTATAVNLATRHNILTINMLHDTWKNSLRDYLNLPHSYK